MKLKSLRGRSKESVYNFINNITDIHPTYSNRPGPLRLLTVASLVYGSIDPK